MRKFIIAILISSVSAFGQFFINQNNSIFSDIKAHNVGDVLTVYIMESSNASRESEMDNSSRTDAGTSSGITGSLTGFLPVFGANAALTQTQTGSEGTSQNDRLTGKISAVITGTAANGLYEIEGSRLLEVNGEKNIMEISGLVRSRDIEDNNIVYSYKIANATIKYSTADQEGNISNRRPGRVRRIIVWTIGGLMAIMGVFGTGAL